MPKHITQPMNACARIVMSYEVVNGVMTLVIAPTMKMIEMSAEKISSVKRVTCFISAEMSKSAISVVKSAVHSPSQHRAGRNSRSIETHIR